MKVRNGCVKMEYGLIGSNLTHSFSKYLHEEFLNTKYELKSLNNFVKLSSPMIPIAGVKVKMKLEI